MQASIVKGALVKTALAELLEATVKLPKDETDLLQASPPPPALFPLFFNLRARCASNSMGPITLPHRSHPQSFVNLNKDCFSS
jgi:hypothetical protein